MPLIVDPMLDFSKLRTPPTHGDVLVAPDPHGWPAAAEANAQALGEARTVVFGSTLGAWRHKTRMVTVGRDDRPIIVTGHQPAFIHPGVWAKHIVAMRFAGAVGGVAVGLVVDSDVPGQTGVTIPAWKQGRMVLEAIPFAELRPGQTYDQIARHSPERIEELHGAIAGAMGDRFAESQMPTFLEALRNATGARDWVDQIVTARRAVEANFEVGLDERRVSELWLTPLLGDMLTNAARFAASYNKALADYRLANRIRGVSQPIPDLVSHDDRQEVPLWVYRGDEPRRRLLVGRRGTSLRLFADTLEIGTIASGSLETCDALEAAIGELAGWKLRPRALTLTLWARLLLADLFVHGIGGAKYDRISDAIMADYYGVAPPYMACVSATLLLDLPAQTATPDCTRRLRHSLRDLEYNPQRHLPPGADVQPLIEDRGRAVRLASDLKKGDPRNRAARRRAFLEIRGINAELLKLRGDILQSKRACLTRALNDLRQADIAHGREYFFCLYDRQRLEQLSEALPQEMDFRV